MRAEIYIDHTVPCPGKGTIEEPYCSFEYMPRPITRADIIDAALPLFVITLYLLFRWER